MEHPGLAQTSNRIGRTAVLFVTLALIAGAIALRASMLFSKALPPGIDAAYYPLQARGIIENGKLPYVDVPLIFRLDAALAKVLMAPRGMDVDSATLLASRIVDAIAQPLVAIPIAMIGLGFARAIRASRAEGAERSRSAIVIGLCVLAMGAIAALSPPILRMTGDFQKNSLGLVWMAGCAWATYRALGRGGMGRWALVAAFLVLAALTHIGAFGVTVVLAASTISIYAMVRSRPRPKTIALAGLACIVGAGVLWGLVYVAAPSKAIGMAEGVTKMFGAGDRPPGGPIGQGGPGGFGPNADRLSRDPGARGGPPQGPPGGFPASSIALRAAGWGVLLVVGGIAISRARRVGAPEFAVVGGCAFTSAVVTCPLIQGQYAERLSLMTPIPLAVIIGFLLLSLAYSERRWARRTGVAIGVLVSAGILFAAVPMAMRGKGVPPPRAMGNEMGNRGVAFDRGGPPGGGGGSVVADEAIPEFRSMRGLVPTDGSAVVLARHGLQWWAGYFLKTPVAQENANKDRLEKYDEVYVLTEKRGGPGRDMPGGESRFRVPPDAEIVHDGEFYTLVRLPVR